MSAITTTNLVLDFAQHFFLANIVDPQGLPYTRDQTPLERKKGKGNVI
jgi:hypothetical protein